MKVLEFHRLRDERQVRVDVDCGPCQKKVCPLKGTAGELACMTRIDPSRVIESARQLLGAATTSIPPRRDAGRFP